MSAASCNLSLWMCNSISERSDKSNALRRMIFSIRWNMRKKETEMGSGLVWRSSREMSHESNEFRRAVFSGSN